MTKESNMEIKNEKFLATNVPFASHQKSYSDLTCDMWKPAHDMSP